MSDPLCSIDPTHGRGSHGTVLGPVCAECWRVRVARGLEGDITDGVKAGVRGLGAFQGRTADGKVPVGATDSLYRGVSLVPVRGHDEMTIELNGHVVFTQAPAVHVNGARYADSDGKVSHAVKSALLDSEHRSQLHDVLRPIAEGVAASEIDPCDLLGISSSQLRRARRGRSK